MFVSLRGTLELAAPLLSSVPWLVTRVTVGGGRHILALLLSFSNSFVLLLFRFLLFFIVVALVIIIFYFLRYFLHLFPFTPFSYMTCIPNYSHCVDCQVLMNYLWVDISLSVYYGFKVSFIVYFFPSLIYHSYQFQLSYLAPVLFISTLRHKIMKASHFRLIIVPFTSFFSSSS